MTSRGKNKKTLENKTPPREIINYYVCLKGIFGGLQTNFRQETNV